jgi:hypothetical protein
MDTNLYGVFDDPARRRFWLIIKALETTPFGKPWRWQKGLRRS